MTARELLVKIFGSIENARFFAERNTKISQGDFDSWKADDIARQKARKYAAPRQGHSRVTSRFQWHS